MCLIIFAHRATSRFPLVLAANRDEFFSRSTQQASFWDLQAGESEEQQIIAGKDLVAGGTWLGITHNSRFAAVTNIRDPSQPELKLHSRGELTLNFLKSTISAEAYCESLTEHFDQYAGFNLLIGDGTELFYANNFEHLVWRLKPGIYGLSNGLLDSPWPKVETGKQRLQNLLESNKEFGTDELIDMMADRSQASAADLPNTGVSNDLEKILSSAFILNQERLYGTLCSTAIIADAQGAIHFCEQNYDSSGKSQMRHDFEFKQS